MPLSAVIVCVDIAAGPAAERLNEFTSQVNVQALFDFTMALPLQTNSVHACGAKEKLFEQLLKGTRMQAYAVNGRTFAIVPFDAPPVPRPAPRPLPRVRREEPVSLPVQSSLPTTPCTCVTLNSVRIYPESLQSLEDAFNAHFCQQGGQLKYSPQECK
jgi:hypothetical protein